MPRDYWFAFGSGNPATNASLAPTFITFANSSGTTFSGPTISEKPPGSGLYTSNYGATQTMAFILDGATVGLAASDRYIVGVFDPYDQFGVTLNSVLAGVSAIGITLVAQGVTLTNMGNTFIGFGVTLSGIGLSLSGMGSILGSTASSYGSTIIDPVDVMGYLKRSRELAEGNQIYTKATGLLDLYVRGGATLLIEKTISDSSTQTTKT